MYFDILNRLGVDRECDGRTDRQTDGHNSNSAVYYSLHAPSSNTQYQNKNLNKQGKVAFDLPLQSPGPVPPIILVFNRNTSLAKLQYISLPNFSATGQGTAEL